MSIARHAPLLEVRRFAIRSTPQPSRATERVAFNHRYKNRTIRVPSENARRPIPKDLVTTLLRSSREDPGVGLEATKIVTTPTIKPTKGAASMITPIIQPAAPSRSHGVSIAPANLL